MRIRKSWQRHLFWIFATTGLLLVLIGTLVDYNVSRPCFFFENPLFYEVAAYLSFIASPLSLISFAGKSKSLFREENARKFYETLVTGISKADERTVNAALEILLENFDDICKAVKNPGGKAEIRQSARAIFDVILSESSVVNILATKRLDALLYIFARVEAHRINQGDSSIGIPKVAQALFFNRESFLYKQLERGGLALSSNAYETIFGSPILLTNFDFFGFPTWDYVSRDRAATGVLKVLIKALSKAISTYLKTGHVPPRHINEGLSHLSGIFGGASYKISVEERRGIDTKYALKSEWWALQEIASFLSHDYIFLDYQEQLDQKTVEREKNTTEASFYSEHAINEGIAAVLYRAFEQLDAIENTEDLYHLVLQLLRGVMGGEKYKEGYGKPFEKRIWEQIAKNVARRHYPGVLRTYLVFIGFALSDNRDEKDNWLGIQTERMRRLLYVDLMPLLEKGEIMVNKKLMKDELLPKSMDYKDGKFTYSNGDSVVILTPPPEGSKSALEGVDMDSGSLL